MLVHGMIVPPRSALEAVSAVVRSVPAPQPVAPEPPRPSKGLLGRLTGRNERSAEVTDAEEPPVAAAVLDHVPTERMHIPITNFGNLTTTDAHRLADAVAGASGEWPAPRVHLAGGTALDFPGDWSVWARIDGDLDALSEVARGVVQSVESLGFFVDRRQFRPMLSVATVTTATTGPYLQAVVDALEAFRGEEWIVDVTLTKETFVGGQPELTEFRRITLAT